MQFAQRVQQVKPSPTLALNARAKKMQSEGINVINFTCGEPDFDTPEHIKEAAVAALKAGFTKYTPVGGIIELKDAVINSLKREQGLTYSRDEVLITLGAKYAIFSAMQALLQSGDEVIIPAPYWVSYPDQVLLCEAKPVILPARAEDNFKITPELLGRAITKQTKMFIMNSPSNPSGMAYDKNELEKIAQVCVKNNLWVLSDEIYDAIVFDGFKCVSIATLHGMKERTIVVNGVSKKFAMTGWRMGYSAAPRELTAHMDTIQGQSATCVTSITQKACVAAYNGDQSVVKNMTAKFEERRNYIVERLNNIKGIKCAKPNGSFYVFPDVSGVNKNDSELAKELLDKAHVAVVPGEAFGTKGHIRISFATSFENIKEGMDRIEKCVNKKPAD